MPARPIALAWQPHADAYAWLVDRFRADPDFKRVVKVFVTRIPGSSNDDNPPAPAMCPWVRLTPSPESQYPVYTRGDGGYGAVHESPLLVTIETATAGFGVQDGMAPWALAWDILLGSKYTKATVASHRKAWINHYTMDQPTAIESAQPDSGSGLVYGAGSIRLYVRA